MLSEVRQWIHTVQARRIRRKTPARRREAEIGLVFLSPWILGLLLFKLFPILLSFGLSFTNFFFLTPKDVQFIGLRNYALFFKDPDAWKALGDNLRLALTIIPVQLGAAIGLAAVLNSKYLAGKLWFRTLFFLPAIIPGVAAMMLWRGVLNQQEGWLMLYVLRPLGLSPLMGLLNGAGINPQQMAMALWSIGPGFVILLAAMQAVDPVLLEAARVDGAGAFARLFRVTLPLISPAIFFNLVINLVSVLGGAPLFDRGDPRSGGTSIFDAYIQTTMFSTSRLGYAASLGCVLLIFTGLILGVVFWSARYWVFYPAEEA